MKKINFYSGPAILPPEVLQQAAAAIEDFEGLGLSILEISHRHSAFEAIMAETRALVRELYALPDDYEVLLMSGGASTQFALIPMNLLPSDGKAAYLQTGKWAENAIQEARLFGEVEVVASSADRDFTYIPKDYAVDPQATYFHITTNNTIFGTQLHELPPVDCPLVADMSSDIFSKPLDVTRFGLIYAGAQKNAGAAGITLVIVRKDLLGKVNRAMPTMFNYQTFIEHGSMFNTPPVFAVYVCCLTLRWIRAQGLAALEQRNGEKATLLYNEIDRNPLFFGRVEREDRSLMNVNFNCTNTELEPTFLQFAQQEFGCVGIKGYRTMGGFRASLYNALPLEGVQTLVKAMQEFERMKG